jgi:hypothetical protein
MTAALFLPGISFAPFTYAVGFSSNSLERSLIMADMSTASKQMSGSLPSGQKVKDAASSAFEKTKDTASSALDKTKNAATAAVDRTKDAAASAYDKSKDAISTAFDKTKETADAALDRAKNMASSAAQQIGDTASAMTERAEGALGSVGSEMKSLAGTLRSKAPHSGIIGGAASDVASCMETTGTYLETHGFSQMAEDVSHLVRRYPMQSILLVLGVGFLMGRSVRR